MVVKKRLRGMGGVVLVSVMLLSLREQSVAHAHKHRKRERASVRARKGDRERRLYRDDLACPSCRCRVRARRSAPPLTFLEELKRFTGFVEQRSFKVPRVAFSLNRQKNKSPLGVESSDL